MSIRRLFQEAQTQPLLFKQRLGISKEVFEQLLVSFNVSVPKHLSNQERLFAVLYAEYKKLSPRNVGDLLDYVNAKRDGAIFLERANNALTRVRREMSRFGLVVPALNLPAPILISYRNDQGKAMHGAFYDHYTLRRITGSRTCITKSGECSTKTFEYFIDKQTIWALGINQQAGKRVHPAIKADDDNSCGLLVIPGHSSSDKDEHRKQHEAALISKARNRGQPILAICAGSWRLWEGFGGTTKDVDGHSYSNMPYIVNDGGVGNNKQIHDIKLRQATLLAGAMRVHKKDKPLTRTTVNSVHWKAVDERIVPNMLALSATAVANKALEPRNRQGEMSPERTVEAFETKYGAPMLGIQWHPEAYYNNKESVENAAKHHLCLINYMAKAGDAYKARITMVDEFKNVAQLLVKQGLFKNPETNGTLKPSLLKPLMKNS